MITMLRGGWTGANFIVPATTIGFGLGHGDGGGNIVVGQVVGREDGGDEFAVPSGSVHDGLGHLGGGE